MPRKKPITPGLFVILALLAGSCGPDSSEVWLSINADGSKPCLGAAHMEIQVITQKGVNVFHEFGQFFNGETHDCAIGQFRFPELPLGNGIQVSLSMWDSTSDQNGQLSTGASLPFNVKEGGPTTQLEITMSRRLAAALGSIVIYRPSNWAQLSGVNKLQYRIIPAGEQTPARAGYFSYSPGISNDPFPLIISSLPLTDTTVELGVIVEAVRDTEVLATWTASAWLGPELNPGYVQFQ